MMKPKFELKCNGDGGSNKVFILKNVSNVITSNIRMKTFELISIDDSRQNLLNQDIHLPTSLGPNQQEEFTFEHREFRARSVGDKCFEFVFYAEDDECNVFRCVAEKNVEDLSKREYVLGLWNVTTYFERKIQEETLKESEEKSMETKIFISHRGKDSGYAEAVVDFLEDLGVAQSSIVCTSVPEHLIPNGKKIYDWLREQFLNYNLHVLFLLSRNYYESPDCLNEMGAAWATKSDFDVILLPGFSPENIKGCIGSDTMAMHCDGNESILRDRIRQLRDKVCTEFGLVQPSDRRWETKRDQLIQRLKEVKTETEDDQR